MVETRETGTEELGTVGPKEIGTGRLGAPEHCEWPSTIPCISENEDTETPGKRTHDKLSRGRPRTLQVCIEQLTEQAMERSYASRVCLID